MYKSKRSSAKKDRQKLFEENVKLTEDISALEDALILHQRFSKGDSASLRGVIRQELGGSRWQYGGEGKLHSFKSKHDLSEIQKLNFGHSAKDGRENGPRQKAAKSKSKPKLHEDRMETESSLLEPSVLSCENADEGAQVKSIGIIPAKLKGKSLAKRYQKASKVVDRKSFTTWDTRPGESKVEGRNIDYGRFMSVGDFLHNEGINYDEEISFEETSMGMSVSSEHDGNSLTDLKTKVLKKASTVFFVRHVPNTHCKVSKVKTAGSMLSTQHKDGYLSKASQMVIGHNVKKKLKSHKNAKQNALFSSRQSVCPGRLTDSPQESEMTVVDEKFGQDFSLMSTPVSAYKKPKNRSGENAECLNEILHTETGVKMSAAAQEKKITRSALQCNQMATNSAGLEKGKKDYLLDSMEVKNNSALKSQDSSVSAKTAIKSNALSLSEVTVGTNTKAIFSRPSDKWAFVNAEDVTDSLTLQMSPKQTDSENWTNNSDRIVMQDVSSGTSQSSPENDTAYPSVHNSKYLLQHCPGRRRESSSNSLIKKSIENDDNKDSEKEQQIWSIQPVKPQIITSRDTAIPRALAEWIQKSLGLDSQDIEQKGVTEWDLVSDENPATGVIRSSMIESSQNVVREQSLQTSCIDKQVKRLPIFFDLDAEENIHKLENSIRASEVSIQALDCDSRVAAWLASLGLANVATFQQIFAEHQVDFSDLYFLTASMLQEMGISRLGPIMKILRGIDKLKEEKENKLVQLDKVENKMLRRNRSKRAWPETGDDRGQERGKKDSLPRRRDCVSKSFKRDHIGSQNKKSVEKALQLEKFDDHKTLTADNAKTISSKKIYSLLCDGGSESYSAWRNPSIVTPSFDQNLTSKALVEKTKSKTSLKFSKPSSVISSRTAVSCVQNRDCKSSYKTDVKFKNETSDVKETSHQDTLQQKTSNGGLSTACVLKRKSAKSQQESKGDILDQHPDQLHNAMAARNKVTDHSKVADNDLESSQSNQQLRDPQAEQQISYREETLNAVRDLQHKLQQLEHCILHKKTTSTSSVAAGATLKKTDAAYNLDFSKTDHTGDLYYSELQRALTNTKRNVTSVSKGNQGNGLNNTVTVGHANDIYSNGCSAWGTQNHDSVTEDSMCEDVHGTVKHKQQKEDSEDLRKRSGVSKHQQNSIGGLMNKSSRMEKEMHVPEEVLVVAGMKCGRDENDGEDFPDRCITEIVTFEKKQPMSKRQLRDEIRRERDEHRKNVRHLKLELSKLQHYDPMKNSEIDRATILFRESDLIGEGSFSQVFKGQYQGAEVAVKRLRTPLCLQDRTYFASEVSLLRDLRHPCVVLLIGISTADSLPIMVLEYMAGRDLYTLIHDSNRHILDHAEFYQIARDVGSGMVYLHHHHPPVLHLNLKSMNVLLTTSHHAKIADFGFSKLKHDADKKVKKATRNKNIKVSPAWMAPELLHGGEITPKADVFSFGIILWEMMSGKHPYEGCTVFQILELVRTNKRPDICETCPADLRELISVCWAQNPAVRPNFKEVLQKIEDLSFPAGWRELFKDARIPNEALEDVPSTSEIISLVTSTLESSAAKKTLHTMEMTSFNIKEKEPGITTFLTTDNANDKAETEEPQNDTTTHNQKPNLAQRQGVESIQIKLPMDMMKENKSCSFSKCHTTKLTTSLDATQSTDCLATTMTTSTNFHHSSTAGCNATLSDSLDVVSSLSTSSSLSSSSSACSKDSLEANTIPIMTNRESAQEDRPYYLGPSQDTRNVSTCFDRLSIPASNELSAPKKHLVQSSIGSFSLNSDEASAKLVLSTQVYDPSVLTYRKKDALNAPPCFSSPAISYISHLDASDSKNPTTLSGTIKAKQDGEVKGEEHIEKDVHAEKNSCARLSAREARRLGVSRRSSDVWSSSSCASTGENRGLATASDDGLSDMQGLTAYVLNDSSLAGNKLMDSRLLLDLNNNSDTDTDTAESNVTAGGTHQELVSVNMNVVDQNSSQPDACVVPVENDVRDICEGKVQGHKEEDGYKHIKGVKNSGSLSSSCAIIPPPPPPPPPPPLAASSTPHFSTAQVCQNGFLADVQDDSQQSVSKETLASSSKHSLKERYRGNPHISVEASELMRQKDQLRPTAQPHPSQLQEVSTTAQEFTSLADIFKKAMVNRRFAMEGNSLATSTNSQEFSDVNWSLQED